MPKKIVLDTNIWISGIIWGGLPGEVLSKLEKDRWGIYVSPSILEEIDRVLDHSKIQKVLNRVGKKKGEVLTRVLSMSLLVRPSEKLNIITEDPPDNMFLECAVEAKVEYIVTGNSHLKVLRFFRQVKIVTSREFLEKFKEENVEKNPTSL